MRSLRATPLLATYSSGFFSLSLLQMVAVATPLWGNHLGLSVAMIGIAAGCRSISPLIYSIHLGSLMDVVGVRRIMLFFAVQCAVLPLLYPWFPSAGMFALLQLLLGLASSTAWMASQTAIARIAAGDSTKTGWFSFFTSAGTVVGPLALGFVWNEGGAGAGYGLIAFWGFCLLASCLVLPPRKDIVRPKLNVRHLVPRLGSYLGGLTMMRRSVVIFVIACTFVRLGSVSMLESFYPLLLQGFGFSAATVGVLFAIGNLTSSPSSLLAGPWVRICGSPRRGLIISVAISSAAIAVTPALSTFWPLAIAISFYGLGIGVSMPLIFTLLSKGVEADQQGLVAGLRATANRLAGFVLPVTMGIIAEMAGIAAAFWIVGLALLAVVALAEAVFRKRID